jgi:hypothetical protein
MISAMMSVCTICDFWDRGERGERGSGRILKKVWQSEWVKSGSRFEVPNCTQRMTLGTDNGELILEDGAMLYTSFFSTLT